jgi:predicted RNA-binding Zn ribbon-like protein
MLEKDSDLREGFYFLGNHPALDFVNTRPALAGESVELLPDFAALVRWLRAARFLEAKAAATLIHDWGGSGRGRQVAGDARELREKLRKEVLVWGQGNSIRPAMVEELNSRMKEHPMLTRLRQSAGSLVTESSFAANRPEDLISPLAHFAADLFTRIEPGRVRQCANCVLRFHDSSKKGTRRWCSMQLCGNRHKVAAYAKRKRAAEHR